MQLVKTLHGVEIHLLDNGKFQAVIGGKAVLKTTLAALEKELAPSTRTVDVMILSISTAKATTIAKSGKGRGYNSSPEYFDIDGRKIDRYQSQGIYLFTGDGVNKANQFKLETEELYAKYNAEGRKIKERFLEFTATLTPFQHGHFTGEIPIPGEDTKEY